MISSLSAMLFGGDGQDGTKTQEAGAAAGSGPGDQHAPTHTKPEVRLKTREEEMGWLLVNASRSSSPTLSLPELLEKEIEGEREMGSEGVEDTALRRPDGSVFHGELQLSSSEEESSESEGEKSDDCGDIDFSYFTSTTAQDLAVAVMSQSSGDDEDEVDSASCFSQAAITDLSGEDSDTEQSDDPSKRRSHRARSPYYDPALTDSWMVTPPPCFTGTRVSRQVQCNPLEDRLIEQPSLYGKLRSIPRVVEMYDYDNINEEKDLRPMSSRNHFLVGFVPEAVTFRISGLHRYKLNSEQKVNLYLKRILCVIKDMEGAAADQEKAQTGVWPLRKMQKDQAHGKGNTHDMTPAPRSVLAARECCMLGARRKKEAKLQHRHQKAREVKHLSCKLVRRTNKATMALSSSRKQTSARNRGLKPSGNKCGRFGQRAH